MDSIITAVRQIIRKRTFDGTTEDPSRSKRIRPCPVCKEAFQFVIESQKERKWKSKTLDMETTWDHNRAAERWSKFRANMSTKYRRKPWLRNRHAKASSTCDICILFRKTIFPSTMDPSKDTSKCPGSFLLSDGVYLSADALPEDPDFNECKTLFLYMTFAALSGREYSSQQTFRLVLVAGDARSVAGRQPSEEAELPLASTWISQCQQLHPECGNIEPVRLPTRLIYIGGDAEPRLIEASGQIGVYVALSHCWGTDRTLVTIRANIAAHMRCIPLEHMPKTYRDAVFITRKLGFEYLWIDSLCIVQFDPEDWKRECAYMDEVYANAAFTIAAEDADNTLAGMLHKRNKSEQDGLEFIIQPGGANSKLVLRLEPVSARARLYDEYEARTVLDTRAWALQERLMCPRVLQFRSEGMSFMCNRHFRSERLHKPILFEGHKTSSLYSEGSIPKNILMDADLDLNQVWVLVVVNVSRRFLTYEKDKLPSIAAIANLLQRRNGGGYLAGIWQNELKRQIAWHVDIESERRSRTPATQKLPSWTWASTDYPVEGFWNQFPIERISYTFDPVSVVFPAAKDNISSDGFYGGILVLCGTIVEAEAIQMRPQRYQITMSSYSPARQFKVYLYLDAPRRSSEADPTSPVDISPMNLSLLFLGHDILNLMEKDDEGRDVVGPDWCHSWAALALQRVEGLDDTFCRVGLVEHNSYALFGEEPRVEHAKLMNWVSKRGTSHIKLV